MSLLCIFFATFCYVMLRALQQRNVAFDNYGWVVPVSYAMAATDTFIIATVARNGWSWPMVLVYGSAGASGSLLAMLLHKRFLKRD